MATTSSNSSPWPHGIPDDLVLEIVGHTDIPSALALSNVARSWRSFVLGSTDVRLPFRFFTDEDLKDVPSPVLSAVLLRCWNIVKLSGGFTALHTTETLKVPMETLLEMIEGSAERLKSLEVYLDPSKLPEPAASGRSPDDQQEQYWDVQTWQGRLDGIVERIVRMCSGLRHLAVECPYERPAGWTETRCYRLLLPVAARKLLPTLRSLKVVNVKPEYSQTFFELAEQLESIHVSGDGLAGEQSFYSSREQTHLMSPSALRVLFRYLERGQRIKSVFLEEPFHYSSFGVESIFDGLEAGLVHRDEIDPRWQTRQAAWTALEEGLWGHTHFRRDGRSPDLLRTPGNTFYAPPRMVHLPTLEVLHICGLDSHDPAGLIEDGNARQAELATVVAPDLVELYVDSPAPRLAEMFRSSKALRKLTVRRMNKDAMPVDSIASILGDLPLLETLVFDFTYGGGVHFLEIDFRMPKLWPLIGDAGMVLPNLRHLILVNDESSNGTDIVPFVKQRLETASVEVDDRQPALPGRVALQTLGITTRPMYRHMEFTVEEKTWLENNLSSFTLDQTGRSRTVRLPEPGMDSEPEEDEELEDYNDNDDDEESEDDSENDEDEDD